MRSLVRNPRNDDGGFALIFALFVTTMALIGVAAVMTTVAPNVTTSRRSQDATAALAAARSGVDDVVAYLVSIPACRSQSQVCQAALGASSAALAGTARERPNLGTGQSFSWTTDRSVTADGFVRVRATGTSRDVSRTVVADLSLRPSILAYGYYTNYEAFSPSYLNGYYNARNVYLSDNDILSTVSTRTAPQYANWPAVQNASNCGQHWYAEPGSNGRYSTASSTTVSKNSNKWYATGNVAATKSGAGGTGYTRSGGCDLVFTSAMVEDGLTYSRDALYASGSGPVFNQRVFTMWGYNDNAGKNYTAPAFTTAGQYYRGDEIQNSPYLPEKATDDLVLPPTIGTDAIPENSCVYSGPTRVKLNGNGTATVTSPYTKTKPALPSDQGCYPSNVSNGVLAYTFDYTKVGGGAIVVRNLGSAPSGGWPVNSTLSTQPPSATNEVFYTTAGADPTDVATEPDRAYAADRGCETSRAAYSAAVSAPCAWSNLYSTTDGSAGWTTYTKKTCSTAETTNRQLFECEYGNLAATASPSVDMDNGQYAAFRIALQSALDTSSCVAPATGTSATCLSDAVNAVLSKANSGQRAANAAGAATGDHQYVATVSAGTKAAAVTTNGSGAFYPSQARGFFAAKSSVVRTPYTVSVGRQVYGSNKTWGTATPAFQTALTGYDFTATSGSASYFPNPLDVTEYNTGSGSAQPGDLYVDGGNSGKLSLVADNDVVLTGDVTNPTSSTPDTSAVSIAAGKDVRNYHPVSCTDQTTNDINVTSAGWCPNDVSGIGTADNIAANGDFTFAHPTQQYQNIQATGDRTVEAALFAVAGSLRTDNYDRADWVGNLNVHGGIYQNSRGGNGVLFNGSARSGTTLQYKYVDLQRANLPYVPPATSGNYSRPWNVVSLSSG